MNCFNLHDNSDISSTLISNIFIDEYMPSANGTYVKVYITLLRMLSAHSAGASVSGIADVLDIMENDVLRAFNYWERQSLLSVKRGKNEAITDVTVMSAGTKDASSNISVVFNPLYNNTDNKFNNSFDTVTDGSTAKNTENFDFVKTAEKDEFKWIAGIVEKYMEHPLQMSDVEVLAYMYETLQFPPDLILHLYEYCISHGKKNSKYIQAVALNWAKEGINTVDKASAHTSKFDTDYMEVMRTFGLNQPPAPAQKQYIDIWLTYGFSAGVIKEACNRTMIAINEPSFKYANGILENWHALGVKSLEDVKKADADRAARLSDKPSHKKQTQKKTGSFSSYEQRIYSSEEYSSLERQLLEKK